MKLEELKGYEILEKRYSADLDSDTILLRHKKTGARVACISNQDENKVFYITFRTPPKDSTGVAHIIEHTVLCGSRKYPVKDPFVELAKGSLNTFLNAMTYPDKTMYPVASCNDKDFKNLMHVYLDAVLYPNIYKTDKIFRQEGWHYEMESPEDDLHLNGVVYNEMKGAFSSPDDVLEREIMNSLYPETTYGLESGGDPEVIPQLTYEEYLDFHRKYYHPSNAYIYLYGNMDMAETLEDIDRNYLADFEANPQACTDSRIEAQKPFAEPRRIVKEYPVSEDDEEKENAYLSLNFSVADSLDRELYVAFQILDYALCSAPGAPLKQALVDQNIGKDVYSIYENGILQPYFSVIAKNVNASKEREFLQTIHAVLENIVQNGFDKKALLAGINYYEFKYREADFGSYPKGLIYGIQIMDSWLYDDSKPFIHVEANDTFAALKKKVDEGYFEGLVRLYLLTNPHKSNVVLIPEKGLTEQKDRELAESLQRKKEALSPEEIDRIVTETRELREYQDSEDSPEDLAKIPMLSRQDIGKAARKPLNEERRIKDTPVLYHPIFTNGIGYLRMIFKLRDIPEELFAYLGILKGTLGLLNTARYRYGDLFNEINIQTGGMSAVNNVYENVQDGSYLLTLELKTKVLYHNIDKALELMREIVMTSDFSDYKRLKEIVAEGVSRMQAQMISAGHSLAVNRAISYGSEVGAVNEILSGVDFYRFCTQLESHFEERKEELTEKLEKLAQMIFRKENLMVDFVGTEDGYGKLPEAVERFEDGLYTGPVEKKAYIPAVSVKNEGFMTSGQVQYVCRAGNFRKKGLPYHGALKALKVMMEYDYLWINVRVKGGAYGCMCSFRRNGEGFFVSYRDPNLEKTVEIYQRAAEAVASFKADERTMTQFIIGAVSELDTPMTPSGYGMFSLSAYMTGVTHEMLEQDRAELLAATPETIRGLAKYIEAFMEEDLFCVVGNAEKIREASDQFDHIENLF